MRLIVISFATVILTGTVLLVFPFASAAGQWTSPGVTLFTSTSATCVTGLIVVDTGSYWSTAGQAIILLLIQVGGLGLATIVGAFYTFFSKVHSWRQIELTRESTASPGGVELTKLLRWIIGFTLTAESIGAILLIWRFGHIMVRRRSGKDSFRLFRHFAMWLRSPWQRWQRRLCQSDCFQS